MSASAIRDGPVAAGSSTATRPSVTSTPGAAGRAIGYLLFAIVVAGIVLGIAFIVATGFGKALSFEHVYPTIVSKH